MYPYNEYENGITEINLGIYIINIEKRYQYGIVLREADVCGNGHIWSARSIIRKLSIYKFIST